MAQITPTNLIQRIPMGIYKPIAISRKCQVAHLTSSINTIDSIASKVIRKMDSSVRHPSTASKKTMLTRRSSCRLDRGFMISNGMVMVGLGMLLDIPNKERAVVVTTVKHIPFIKRPSQRSHFLFVPTQTHSIRIVRSWIPQVNKTISTPQRQQTRSTMPPSCHLPRKRSHSR